MHNICDVHNEIIKKLNKAGKALLEEKEKLVGSNAVKQFALTIKEIGGIDGLIKKANDMATIMENGLIRRRKVMEEMGIESTYQFIKKNERRNSKTKD